MSDCCCRPSPAEPCCSTRTVERVGTRLTWRDRLGGWRVRWGFGRSRYRVEPGLYAAGDPDESSPVLVTASFKLSFDRLRSQLAGRDAWILVLDTRGINVWCAAGKGTFGTEELVRRANAVGLTEVVSHRTLVLPQLGAPGVAAHEVRRLSPWRVKFGPVRAEDLPAFLDAGLRASPAMRRVRFKLADRLAVVPVDLVQPLKVLLPVMGAFLVLSGLGPGGYSLDGIRGAGARSALLLFSAHLAGAVFTPILLPWIPGRAFALKGALLGAIAALGVAALLGAAAFDGRLEIMAWLLLVPAIASFLAMNFTGASTFTSLSGVRREMRVAVPLQAATAGLGLLLWLVARFVQ